MLFNSVQFFVFLAATLFVYHIARSSIRIQNLVLLAASYVFYGSWDWRYLSLIISASLLTWYASIRIADATNQRARRGWLIVCVVALLGVLAIFKYLNFFIDSAVTLLNSLGIAQSPVTLSIILPVGISFFVFQTAGYVIDVYRGDLPAERDPIRLLVFIAFFPQLVAGPIERASNLLPQFSIPRRVTPDGVWAGIYLVLWGLFKKVVIADQVALTANRIFDNYGQYSGLDIWIGVLAFAVQIYCDFSAYTDIARGVARFFGFELMVNFRLPYFAVSPSDFWNRWHISLSSWLRDYLYIPLGGNRGTSWQTYRNLFLTMLLGGLWHGAAWNFVLWGMYHGIILIVYRRFERRPIADDPFRKAALPIVLAKMGVMFCLTLVGWLFFRAATLPQIGDMLTSISPLVSSETLSLGWAVVLVSLPLIVTQIFQYATRDLLAVMRLPFSGQVLVYAALLAGILIFGVRVSTEFIYFQF